MLLTGKNAVVTGANRGIGLKVIEVFAQQGAHIWACARKKNEEFENHLCELSDKYKVNIVPVYFDLNKTEEIKLGMQQIIKKKEKIDVLVNNAGVISESKLFQMKTIEEMKQVFEVNFFAPTLIMQYISRVMIRQQNGVIINLSSIAAIDGDPAQFEYVSSKAALIGATKKLAIELGNSGIRVNAVAPGITSTDMGNRVNDEILQGTLNRIIMKRMAEPEEIANVVLFLASDLSTYMTGQVIRVDGGSL